MLKRILFISSVNLTSNPRLLKELKYAVELGHEVFFIGFRLGNWSDEMDREITKKVKANFTYLSAVREPFIKWLLATIYEKVCRLVFPFFKQNTKIAGFTNKRTILLCNYLKNHIAKYDFIAAHTLPTLYAAYRFSVKTNTKFTFDIEDYHIGETCTKKEQNIRKLLMQELIPKANLISYASPLIGLHSLELCNNNPERFILINNCFSMNEFIDKNNCSEKIKFVWFSQNIAQGRGLEQVLPVMENFKTKLEVHLIGNLYQDFYTKFLSNYSSFVVIHKPASQVELHKKLSEFDIGLAIELNKVDYNRQICLTNKIWAYFQSGLYILATDTPAQVQFMKKHSNCGTISQQSSSDLFNVIVQIIEGIDEVRQNKKQRYQYAQQYSWEIERTKLTMFT